MEGWNIGACNFSLCKWYVTLDIMIKPDGVQRKVIGNIISRFEAKGYQLKGLKLTTPSVETLEEHYKDLKSKSFFPKLMSYMSSGTYSSYSIYPLCPCSYNTHLIASLSYWYNPFYRSLGPVVAMVWEGKDAVKTGRVMLGATNPADSLPGTATLTHPLPQ